MRGCRFYFVFVYFIIKVLNVLLLPDLRTSLQAANQHITMISEGSCDTEDWSNDAENSALHHRNTLHFKIY